MIDRKKQVLASSLLVLFLLGGQALAQVTIKKDAPPPLELNIEDCVSATITAPEVMTVYVVGTATEAKEGLIAKVTTEKFEINPGVNHYSAANIPPIAETWIAPKYEGLITRTGKFPEGNYTIHIQLFTEKGEPLDEDERRQEVKYPQIRLVYPPNGATITPDRFQWMTTRPIPELEYKLSICEVLEGQTPEEASEAGISYFEQDGIRTTSLPYPIGARAFLPGANYSWQVEGFIEDSPIVASEIWSFVFGMLKEPEKHSEDETKKWKEGGHKYRTTRDWINKGHSYEETKKWPEDHKQSTTWYWDRKGHKYEETKKWPEDHKQRTSWNWHGKGHKYEDTKKWPEDHKQRTSWNWHGKGHSYEDTKKWPKGHEKTTWKWHGKGHSYEDTKKWPKGHEKTTWKWHGKGHKYEETKKWPKGHEKTTWKWHGKGHKYGETKKWTDDRHKEKTSRKWVREGHEYDKSLRGG